MKREGGPGNEKQKAVSEALERIILPAINQLYKEQKVHVLAFVYDHSGGLVWGSRKPDKATVIAAMAMLGEAVGIEHTVIGSDTPEESKEIKEMIKKAFDDRIIT